MKKIIFFGLFIITIVVLTGCFDYSLERIVYEDWLCTVNTDGTDLNYLRPLVGHLVVTPDSERVIIFSSNHVYSMNIDGSDFTTLNDSIGSRGAFPSTAETPEGIKIVFSHNQDIYELDLESTEIINLTNTPNIQEMYPCYSHDGTKIVYSTLTEKDSTITVSIMDYDGENKSEVIKHKNLSVYYYSSFRYPCFSINDNKIFYIWSLASSGAVDRGLYVFNLEDSTNQYLFEGYFIYPVFPVSMPANGSKIVFYASDNIYSMNEDGSDLTNLGPAGPYRPVFSSDGSKILFGYGHLYIMNSDGSERRRLIDDTLEYHCNAVFLPDNKVMCTVERRVQ
ncbi:MAG: TolB family protein [Candidatus Cloacimonadia bacterium]